MIDKERGSARQFLRQGRCRLLERCPLQALSRVNGGACRLDGHHTMALAWIGDMLGRIDCKAVDELLSQLGWRDDRIDD
jgi:hypothetical protein